VLLSSGDSFPHLIQKPSSQLGFVTYLLNYLRTFVKVQKVSGCSLPRVFVKGQENNSVNLVSQKIPSICPPWRRTVRHINSSLSLSHGTPCVPICKTSQFLLSGEIFDVHCNKQTKHNTPSVTNCIMS
jgi:hypothetical protein